jgi:hypothetical protein
MAVAGEGLAAARMDDFMSFSLQNMELRGHYALIERDVSPSRSRSAALFARMDVT